MIEVRNLNKPITNHCNSNNWLKYWEENSKNQAIFCSERYCAATNLIGAVVQKINDDQCYIIPLCKEHSKARGKILVDDTRVFVLANLTEICANKLAE